MYFIPLPYPDISITPKALPAYMGRLAEQLTTAPELALRHFCNDPFNGQAPTELRITYYHYNMVIPSKTVSSFWSRVPVGTVYLDSQLGKNGIPATIRGKRFSK